MGWGGARGGVVRPVGGWGETLHGRGGMVRGEGGNTYKRWAQASGDR